MDKIYYTEFRCIGEDKVHNNILMAKSLTELFSYFTNSSDIVYFAFEDVTDTPIEEIERRLTYNGKYAM